MTIIFNLIFFIYTASFAVLTVYCLMQLHLLYNYKKSRRPSLITSHLSTLTSNLPVVTIQLPIFNEMYVAGRLIDNIMRLDYPKDKFLVQVLDDSTDETLEITRKKVDEYKALGFQIELVHRSQRKGYKAGALKEALASSKGEFIAIFDADFLPKPDFLKTTLAYFQDKKVGVVQTRWEHLNERFSLITRLQAMQLNVHFSVEQQGRHAGNYLLQFNGTAGVWRRKTIEDAGGWEADTLTEDLDLSIRAQLKGWQIVYLENVGSPAELPAEMNGLKSQQFRWMKGGAETARKMLPAVWCSSLSLGQKIHATAQLFGSSMFVFVFIMGLLSVPVLFLLGKWQYGQPTVAWWTTGMIAFLAVHYVANVEAPSREGSYFKRLVKFILLFPLYLSLSMGLSLHNSIAVIQGFFGKKSAFVRTPKFNIHGFRENIRSRNYLASKISLTTLLEGLLAVYFLAAFAWGIHLDVRSFLFLHGAMALGYGSIFFYTIRHLGERVNE